MKLNLFMCFFFFLFLKNPWKDFPFYSSILLTLWFRYLQTSIRKVVCIFLASFSSKLLIKLWCMREILFTMCYWIIGHCSVCKCNTGNLIFHALSVCTFTLVIFCVGSSLSARPLDLGKGKLQQCFILSGVLLQGQEFVY